jgi:hypothetical protein
MKKIIGLVLGLMLYVSSVWAQSVPGTLIQQSPTRLDSPSNCQTVTAAAAAAATLTITPTGGNSVYVSLIEVTNYASVTETGNVAPNLVTITGLQSSPILTMATALLVGAVDRIILPFGIPVKSVAAGTNVVITSPAFAGAIFRINACYYFAP